MHSALLPRQATTMTLRSLQDLNLLDFQHCLRPSGLVRTQSSKELEWNHRDTDLRLHHANDVNRKFLWEQWMAQKL